jgi:hypothetical protein
MKKFTLALVLSLWFGGSKPVLATSYNFEPVTYANDVFTQMLGINSSGTMVGYRGDGVANPNKGLVTVVSNATHRPQMPADFTDENYPGSTQTQVVAIDAAGDTAGFYVDESGQVHGFVRVGGTFSTADYIPGGSAVTGAGPVVAPPTPNTPPFNQLLSLNDQGIAAGYYQDAAGVEYPYTYSIATGVFTFPTLNNTSVTTGQATGINNSGVISGFYTGPDGITRGFLLKGGSFVSLEYPGSLATSAFGLNNMGQAVGSFADAAGSVHGFLYKWTDGIFQQVDDPLASSANGGTTVNGINDLNQIVGFYADAIGNTGGFVGMAPSVCSTISAGTLQFGAVALGAASDPIPVTYTNCTSTNARFTRVWTIPRSVFAEADTCPVRPSVIPPHASCTVNVNFTPVVQGSLFGLVVLVAVPRVGMVRAFGTGVPALPTTSLKRGRLGHLQRLPRWGR